jgi:hypothetical protein
LYHPDYETFSAYCLKRWGWGRSHASTALKSAEVLRNLNVSRETLYLPEYEKQVRPLARLEPEQQREAWNLAVEQSKTGKPTGPEVEGVVRTYQEIRPKRTKAEIDALRKIAAAKKVQSEADAARLRQFMIFRTLIDSVKFIAQFSMESNQAWNGIWSAGGDEFHDDLRKAQACLARLEREHPNNKKPGPVVHLSRKESV